MIDPSRSRAAAMLGLPATAGEAAVRYAFLKRLPEFDSAPPEAWNAAAMRLGVPRLPLSADALEANVESESADVAEFVARYWDLPPAERKEEWRKLDGRCRDAEVRETLGRLRDGLALAVVESDDEAMDEVARFARELFLLAPREGGIRRLEWCAERAGNRVLFALGHRFQQSDPATAALVPQLLKDMLRADQSPRRIPEMTAQQRERAYAKGLKRARRQELREQVREEAPKAASGGWGRGQWFVLMIVISAAIRGAIALTGSNKTPPPPPIHSPPTFPRLQYTAEQIREFERHDPKSGKPEPQGYTMWRLLGGTSKTVIPGPKSKSTPPR